MKSLFIAILLLFSINLNLHAADYSETSIAIIDLNKILTESKAAEKAGKDIDNISTNIQDEMKISDDEIIAEQQKLIEQQAIIAPEAFEIKAGEFETKAKLYEVERQEKLLKIDQIIQDARNTILESMKPILESLSEELEITIILEKGTVILSTDKMDITDIVLKRLNKELPEIEITLN